MLQMMGIDYEKADLSIRSLFSFQNRAAAEAMAYIKEKCGVDGVIILFTCNRTEIYISAENKIDNLFAIICLIKDIDSEKYINYTVERCGMDAVEHLFKLACGMKSKVFGEDQIITQVKNALVMAREAKTSSSYLERVFQMALAAAKKVKTELDTDTSVAVYVKLPDGFYISTPVGRYNPDWAIAFYEGTVKHIYFVAEMKGSMSSMQLRLIEESKIHCAREHFRAISNGDVVYDVVDSYQSLLDLVRK